MSNHAAGESSVESIAVIGMAGCFPGAGNIAEYWRNLVRGVESITHFSEEEADVHPLGNVGGRTVYAMGLLDGTELFDAAFFGYAPEEAKALDPQHRHFLERGWEALEHAGYCGRHMPGSVGVFAGVSANTYAICNLVRSSSSPGTLFDKDFLTTRLSYKLNLRGPSFAVQSACSTSLVAVCLAAQSLLNYQCDLALAGGASVVVPPKAGYPYVPGGPLSPDGRLYAFDARAAGFVPGSGVGIAVLKRLSEAVADGDTIWAVIKGCAVNNDGAAKIGYAAPSIDGQADVIALAQELAGVAPDTISYVEAHGTGTELGDPIEVAALTQAFRRATSRTGFCALGSVKTNIGHLDAAAGIASLIKVAQALKYGQLPPSLNFERPNPKIDFAASPFFVNDKLRDWTTSDEPRRAGVSSYGIGGTNAHVVLEEAPDEPAPAPSRAWQVLPLAAKSPAALEAAAANLAAHLASQPDLNLADVAYTLQVGRKPFAHRRVIVASTIEEATAALAAEATPARGAGERSRLAQLSPRNCGEAARPVVYLFPGQGAQHPQMARGVYDSEPLFRQTVDRSCELLMPELDMDLRKVIFPGQEDEQAATRLTQTALAQPALFVIEYALAELWKSWGVAPSACIGHSVGEFVAACLAGVFDLPTALRLVATRARLMNRMPRGAMLAVRRSEDEVKSLLTGGVSLAAINGPSLVVLSGPSERIEALEARLKDESVPTVKLHASHAFHSAMMDPILAEFRQCVARADLREPELPYISNVTGTWIERSQPTDPEYWSRHLRQAVRFSPGLEVLLAEQSVLLEVGPGRTLSGLASSHPACGPDRVVAASLRHPQQSISDESALMLAVGQLWLGGVALDWNKLHQPHRRRRVPLPTYPFQRQRFWSLDDPVDPRFAAGAAAQAKRDPSAWYYFPTWKRLPALDRPQDRRGESSTTERWLIFSDGAGLAGQIAAQHEIVVQSGSGFAQLDAQRFQIDPQAKGDYLKLFSQLRDQKQLPDRIVHLQGVTRGTDQDLAAAGRGGFYSLLYLGQALAETGVSSPLKLAVVTDGAHDVVGGERVIAEKSLVQGPCRVLPQEFAHISCRHIDLPLVHGELDAGTLGQLVAEIDSGAAEPVVALRSGQRWAQVYEPLPLGEATTTGHPGARLRQRGVYLITGGLGGIGQTLARWLAETVQARIVLTARTPLPPRDQWTDWLAQHADNDATSRRIAAVQSLESVGAEVLVCAADVCDREAMRRVVRDACQQWGAIHGVIHAAGIAGGGIVQLKTPEIAERVLRPKVEGTQILADVLAGQPLDFFALCSSLAALVGGFGQIDYCSANAYLDAFARQQRAAGGLPVIAINWNAWRDAGMAVETDLPANLRELREQAGLVNSVSNVEGAEAFRRILAGCREPQVAVSRSDLAAVIEQSRRPPQLDASMLPTTPARTQPRPELSTPYVAPSSPTEIAVAEAWVFVFGYEQIGTGDDFFELGGHSLMALQLLERVRSRLGVSLALTDLFEHKTVASLAAHVDALKWAAPSAGGTPDGAASEVAAVSGAEREEITI